MDLNAAQVFVKVIQSGGFSKAARALDMPVSTVSAKVAALERDLGVSLIKRTTRKLHMTAAGESFFQNVQQALQHLNHAQQSLHLHQEAPLGRVKVTAPVEMGASTLIDVLSGFSREFPKVCVELLLTDRVVDLVGEGVDVAIRMGELKDSSLISRKLGWSDLQLLASPQYLKKAPPLKRPQDLSQHRCLLFNLLSSGSWTLRRAGQEIIIPIEATFSANNLVALHRMTLRGHGVALLPMFLCQEDIERGRLQVVLDGWKSAATPVHLVHPQQRFVPKATRALIDYLLENLRDVF